MKAMAMRVEERPQSVEEFVKLLTSPSVPSVVKGVWREVATLRGHEEGVISISFSPDSRFLASGSGTRVKIWKVESWQETVTLAYGYVVYFVSFSPDGRFGVRRMLRAYGSTGLGDSADMGGRELAGNRQFTLA
jgi:WD40 repeat protein